MECHNRGEMSHDNGVMSILGSKAWGSVSSWKKAPDSLFRVYSLDRFLALLLSLLIKRNLIVGNLI